MNPRAGIVIASAVGVALFYSLLTPPTAPTPVRPSPLPPGVRPTVTLYSASWCGPCKAFEPTFQRWFRTHADKASFVHADVDRMPNLTKKANVKAVPTLTVDAGGKEVKRWVGDMPSEAELMTWLK